MENLKFKNVHLNLVANDKDYMKSLIENIQMLSTHHGWSVRALAEKAEMSTETLQTFLKGKSKDCNLSTVVKLSRAFGVSMDELVGAETENKRAELPPEETWRIRKEESLSVLKNTEDIAVLMVWLGDKLSNMRSIYRNFKVEGANMWQRFNQKDEKVQAWYYRSIADLTERLSHTSAWIEYKTLTELVFGKGE